MEGDRGPRPQEVDSGNVIGNTVESNIQGMAPRVGQSQPSNIRHHTAYDSFGTAIQSGSTSEGTLRPQPASPGTGFIGEVLQQRIAEASTKVSEDDFNAHLLNIVAIS